MLGSLADAMSKAKKLFLVRERRETWRFRIEKSRYGYCDQCENETVWLTVVEAAQIAGITDREVFQLANTTRIHHMESDSGAFMICDRSLEAEQTKGDGIKRRDRDKEIKK